MYSYETYVLHGIVDANTQKIIAFRIGDVKATKRSKQ